MKYIVVATLCSGLLLTACTGNKTNTTVVAAPSDSAVLALYKGDFAGSPLYLTINYHNGNKIAGYDMHKGLKRNLTGELVANGSGFTATLDEPGDNPYDGHFTVQFNAGFSTASGSWVPADKNSSLTKKDFQLQRVMASTKEKESFEDYVAGGETLSGEHCDITFEKDGSCTLNYYDRLTDSTFAPQMTTVHGTWEQKDKQFMVNWQSNSPYAHKTSVFTVGYQKNDDGQEYASSLEGDGFQFYIAG